MRSLRFIPPFANWPGQTSTPPRVRNRDRAFTPTPETNTTITRVFFNNGRTHQARRSAQHLTDIDRHLLILAARNDE
jgi:hypothetical protein